MKYGARLLLLLPLYIGLVLGLSDLNYKSDAPRYISFAENLVQGFYSPREAPNLTNGPGYPLVLAIFVALNLPWVAAKLLNGGLLFFAAFYAYLTLRLYMNERRALWGAVFLGLYPPILLSLLQVMTECLTYFLISGLAYHFCRAYGEDQRRRHTALAAAYLGYLALTKIFFGYVIATALVVAAGLYSWRRTASSGRALAVSVGALLLCAPYLAYTYSLTGRVFYWGSPGGDSLYWMSTPFTTEYGDWFDGGQVVKTPQLETNHGEFFRSLARRSKVEQDTEFRERALANMARHPLKFAGNWAMNVGRMLFSYPYSYTAQKPSTYLHLLPNMFLVVPGMLCLGALWARSGQVPYEIRALVFFLVVSFGGSSLVSAEPRHFAVLVPVLVTCILFAASRVIKLEFRC